jgi:hypothetical protein
MLTLLAARFVALLASFASAHLTKATALISLGILFSLGRTAVAAEPIICSIATHPEAFDHRKIDLQGLAADVRETTSQRSNDYTTFNLIDPSGCGTIKIFLWDIPS